MYIILWCGEYKVQKKQEGKEQIFAYYIFSPMLVYTHYVACIIILYYISSLQYVICVIKYNKLKYHK
jgi:hypothetical protein